MKTIIRALSLFLLGVIFMSSFVFNVAAQDGDAYYHGNSEHSLVWENDPNAGEKKVLNRAPGIVVTKKDTVIVYSEHRWPFNKEHSLPETSADWCMMNIVMKRSTDGGKTFSENVILAEGTQEYATVNNPVMIVGNDNTLHFFYCKNYSVYGAGIWYKTSKDDGVTWSEERNLSEYTKTLGYNYNCFAFGPTHGICTSEGVLITCVWLVNENNLLPVTSHGKSTVHLFWSDDNGETWNITPSIYSQTANESAIAEMSDGSILVNARNPQGNRALNLCMDFKTDGKLAWQGMLYHPQLPDANCCGGMTAVDIEGLPYALLNVNCANDTIMESDGSRPKRINVTVKCSFDDGQTFEKSLEISSFDKGGYCDIAVDSKGKAFVVWEEAYGTNVHLTTFSFFDEFCRDEYVMNTDTAITFDTNDSLKLISDYKNMSGELKDGALEIVTESKTTYKGMVIDYSTVTRSIDMSEYKYLLCAIKVDPSTAGNVAIEGHIRSGRTTFASTGYSSKATVPNDGEWHNVIIDLSENDIDGTLQNVQLRFGVENGSKSEIVTASLAGIALFKTELEAQSYQFEKTSVEDSEKGEQNESEADKTDAEDGNETEEVKSESPQETDKGCGSSIGAIGTLGVCATAGAIATAKRKKKDDLS